MASPANNEGSPPTEAGSEDRNQVDTNGNASNKRKRGGAGGGAATTSSRGVANLTPEQLERKRANDREAQRAIRERTKQQIERLNERIRDLESSQPYRELQAVIAQKQAVEQENEEIKQKLASFISIFQRYAGTAPPQGLEELAAAAERNAIAYPPSDQPHILSEQESYNPPPLQPPDHESPHGAPSISISSPANSHHDTSRPWHFGPIQSLNQHRPYIPTSDAPFERHPSSNPNIHPDLAYNHNDKRLGVNFLLDGNKPPGGDNAGANGSPPVSHGQEMDLSPDEEPRAHYNVLSKYIPATCPLDAILLDTISERRRAKKAGLSLEDLEGPPYPNWNALLNKNTPHPSHSLSKLFTDILRTFPDLATLPEQVAVIYIMFLIMRWLAHPTRRNYERMPEWVRPVPSQLFCPHPVWLDFLPWPRLRDTLVQTHGFTNFDNFFIPYTTTLSLNWPYAPSDVLLPHSGPMHPTSANAASPASASSHGMADPNEPVWRMNPAFETHLRDLKNWSLGPLFRDTYPDWSAQGLIRIQEP